MPAPVRKRLMLGNIESGDDVAALRRFVGLSQSASRPVIRGLSARTSTRLFARGGHASADDTDDVVVTVGPDDNHEATPDRSDRANPIPCLPGRLIRWLTRSRPHGSPLRAGRVAVGSCSPCPQALIGSSPHGCDTTVAQWLA